MNKPDLLSDLNQEQFEAVTHTKGPLLVIAGAGTGKTTVITRRIAWLVEQGLAKPSEILALTFTEKAAGEMEARVDQLLAYGQTDTCIATFHAFGDSLLREYALDLGLPPEFRVLAADEQTLFLADRFDEIENLAELRPATNSRKYIELILKVISRAKDELVKPHDYQQAAQELLRSAKTDDDRRSARRQADIASIYAAYEEWKRQEGVIDFGDQILLLYQFLKTEPTLLAKLQKRFRYLLVDEFQDSNVAQSSLVKLLLSPEQNLTVVGDDDQAIYKFRGAAVANIVGFLADFPKAKTVVLTTNYRSSQPILDAAYRLITHNDPDRLEARLGINKHLTGRTGDQKPTFTWYRHDADELDGLVATIDELKKTFPLQEIAILVRSNNLIGPIAAALARAEIPARTSSDRRFTELPEIRGTIAFLRALAHPSDSLSLMKLGLSLFYRLDPAWLLVANDLARKTNRDLHTVLEDADSVLWERLPETGRLALTQFHDELHGYRQLITGKSAGEILYQFYNDHGVFATSNLQPRSHKSKDQNQLSLFQEKPEVEQLAIIQNIGAVFEAIRRYEQAGRDRFALTFVDSLESLLASIIPPSVDLGPEIDAVKILTVHAAKGLEFPIVFLPNLTSDRFPARGRHDPLELPEILIKETLPTGDAHLEEERRLAYVAMTRAKDWLILSGAATAGEGIRPKKPSPFIFESLGLTEVGPPIERVTPAARIHAFAPIEPAPKTVRLPEYNGILFLSPAMIEAYQQDPYTFYWRYVLKAPQLPSRHLNYGNAIHAAIEAYYRWRLERKYTSKVEEAAKAAGTSFEVNPDLRAAVLRRYQEAWRGEGYGSQADEERQFQHGLETLARFIERAQTRPLPTSVEEEFILHLPGVRIRGRMDAVNQREAEIRDFKTSQVETQKQAEVKVKENIPIRIYALAYKRRHDALPKRLILDFVEAGLEASLTPTDDLLQATERLIEATAAGIRAGQFDANPNFAFKDYE